MGKKAKSCNYVFFRSLSSKATRYRVLAYIRDGKVRSESLFERLEERIWGSLLPKIFYIKKEIKERVNDIVLSLLDKMRQVYLLSREEQLSHKEIAERLNIRVKTVEMQIRNALIRIRQSIGELMPLLLLLLEEKKNNKTSKG